MIDKYINIVDRINKTKNSDCFTKSKNRDIKYISGIKIPDVVNFYSIYNPKTIIEINEIRLIPISVIMEESTNYTPGYILHPLGYYVLATTVYGDVYCVRSLDNHYEICIASHDEIFDDTTDFSDKIIPITNNFLDFLERFVEGRLVSDFYDLPE